MKKIKDKMFVVMLSFFIIFAFFVSFIGINDVIEHEKVMKLLEDDLVSQCHELDRIVASEENLDFCDKVLGDDYERYKRTSYETYDSYVLEIVRKYCNEFVLILIIVIGSTFYVTKFLRSRVILNELVRNNYNDVKKKLFFSSWKYSLLVSLMLFIIFIIVILFVGNTELNVYHLSNTIFSGNILVYFGVLLLNSFILTLIYTNISLIVARKEHNYILAVIKSYILIIGIEIFFETILYNIIYKLFGSSFGAYFNLLTVYNYSYTEENLLVIWVLLAILTVTFIILHFRYRNKERLVIDCEKNDNKEEI